MTSLPQPQDSAQVGSRAEQWCSLVGLTEPFSQVEARFWRAGEDELSPVAEARVIEQDVMRTRADEAFFRQDSVRRLMKHALLRYCGYYRLEYMQGLNEILAPLLVIDVADTDNNILGPSVDESTNPETDFSAPSSSSSSSSSSPDGGSSPRRRAVSPIGDDESCVRNCNLCLALFERIIERLAPVIFATRGVQGLQAQLASLHLLLYYFDAELSGLLAREGMMTDVYAQSWLITLFARRSPVHIALHLWGLLLRLQKPHLTIFIAVAFILRNKQTLISLPTELLPETLVRLRLSSEAEVDALVARALELEACTPPSALADIYRYGFDVTLPDKERAPGLRDIMVCSTIAPKLLFQR